MSTAAASDPFEATANPEHYVPRPATERALEALQQGVLAGGGPVALTGPTGLGKTQLLHVLGQRLANGFHVVRLPYPALSGPELCGWVLHALGEPASDDPEGALLDRGFRAAAEGREILLLVEDANALPPGAARSLATLAAASGGAVRVVLAAGDDARTGPTLAALGAGLREVRFEEPMSAAETAEYVRARLSRCAAAHEPRVRRFDADVLARIHAASGGLPRLVHELGSLVWRAPAETDLGAAIATWCDEHEGRVPEAPPEALELDEEGAPPPVLEIGAEDDATPESARELLEEEPEGRVGAPPEAEGARRARRGHRPGLVAVGILALLLAVPYAWPKVESWLADGSGASTPAPAGRAMRETPSAERAPAVLPEPAVEEAMPEPELAPPLRPDEAPPITGELADAEPGEGPVTPASAEAAIAGDAPEEGTSPAAAAEAPSAEPAEGEPAADERSASREAARANAQPAPAGVPADATAEVESPGPSAAAEPAPSTEAEASESATSEPPAQSARLAPEPAAAPEPPAARPAARRRPPGPPPILVNVDAIPSAVIHVDGGEVGPTPLAGLALSPGLHVFRAEFPGGRAVVRAVEISEANRHVHFE